MPPFVRRKKGVTGEGAVDIGVLVAKVLQKAHITENMDFKRLSERFEEVVGKVACEHVKPEKLDKRTLVLKVGSAAWKSEIFMQKNAIIDKCNALLGRPVILAIRIV